MVLSNMLSTENDMKILGLNGILFEVKLKLLCIASKLILLKKEFGGVINMCYQS